MDISAPNTEEEALGISSKFSPNRPKAKELYLIGRSLQTVADEVGVPLWVIKRWHTKEKWASQRKKLLQLADTEQLKRVRREMAAEVSKTFDKLALLETFSDRYLVKPVLDGAGKPVKKPDGEYAFTDKTPDDLPCNDPEAIMRLQLLVLQAKMRTIEKVSEMMGNSKPGLIPAQIRLP